IPVGTRASQAAIPAMLQHGHQFSPSRPRRRTLGTAGGSKSVEHGGARAGILSSGSSPSQSPRSVSGYEEIPRGRFVPGRLGALGLARRSETEGVGRIRPQRRLLGRRQGLVPKISTRDPSSQGAFSAVTMGGSA